MDNYEIKIEHFEGPFDLLLFFIERDELNIHDIPISKITEDFLDYIHKLHALNIEVASEFIYMASILMRIKAKMLLPRSLIEDDDSEDLKKDLVQKLILYKQFKDICEKLRPLEELRMKRHSRGNVSLDLSFISKKNTIEEELSTLTLYRLMLIYHRIMEKYQSRVNETKHTVIKYPYTIEQQKKLISELLEINTKLDFQSIISHSENKVQFVYNFLAILEMLQQKLIDIQIGIGYNSFWIEKNN